MINRKYWRPFFLKAIKQKDFFTITYLLENNCEIDDDIFTAIIKLPDIDLKTLELSIKAKKVLYSHNLEQIITLFPENKKLVIQSINATDYISDYLLETLSKLDYIDLNLTKNILEKLISLDEYRLSEVLELVKNDQELINLAISKIKVLFSYNLQQIFAIPNITSENIKLAIEKTQRIEEWNVTELLALHPGQEIIFSAIKKVNKLFSWHLQSLLCNGYNQPEILKLCISKIDKLESWHLDNLLQLPNIDGELIRLALDKIDFINDTNLIKLALNQTDFIHLNHLKLLLESGIFDDISILAVSKLRSNLPRKELEYFMIHHYKPKFAEKYLHPENSTEDIEDSLMSGAELNDKN
ncbi:MAG: hypothetical protein H6909_00560 [Rickettsiaceae bacterium]|nr:hypothetical protein [Rickettsiaceae bacterium]